MKHLMCKSAVVANFSYSEYECDIDFIQQFNKQLMKMNIQFRYNVAFYVSLLCQQK